MGNRTDGGRTYNAANEVVGFTYDEVGNLLNDGSTSYTYDALGRLTQQGGTSYTYNGDGVLVGRGSTSYTQDLVAPLEQVLHDGTTNLVYGLARIRSSTGTWYQHDGLGSVRAVLDNAGVVQSTTSYDPWGVPTAGSTDPFGFTGELHDGDLVHLRARWYHPSTGTFTSRDPFKGFDTLPYSLHPYQYAYSVPTTWSDPSGACLLVAVAVDGPLPIGDAVALVTCLSTLGLILEQQRDTATQYYQTRNFQRGNVALFPGAPRPATKDAVTAAQAFRPGPVPAPAPLPPEAPPIVQPPAPPSVPEVVPVPVPEPIPAPAPQPVPSPTPERPGIVLPDMWNCPQPAPTPGFTPQPDPTILPTPTPERRNGATVQIQGSDITQYNVGAVRDTANNGWMLSHSWSQPHPISTKDARRKLANLWKRLTPAQQHRRGRAYYRAVDWIDASLTHSPPGRRAGERVSFQNPEGDRDGFWDARVDVSVFEGIAFDVP